MSSEALKTSRGIWTAVVVGMLVMGQLVAARAIRDGFFLSHFPASDLPIMVASSAVLSVFFVLGITRQLRDLAPARTVPWLFAASALMFALEWLWALYQPGVAAIILYMHVMSLVALVASGYWSVVSERFDPYTAKLSIGRIGGGATLGGVFGGVAAWWGATRVDVATMLLALAVLNLCCALGVKKLGAGSRPAVGRQEVQESGLTILRQTPYLRDLALLVAMSAFCQACYDIVFKSRVAEHYAQGSELVSFFALFYVALNVCTFLVQNLLTHRSMRNYGLSFTVATLPGSGLILGGLALLFPGLGTAVAMRGGVGVAENSTYRSGYELLYTPVLPHKKRPTKTIIDVAGEMSGAFLGGACAYVILAMVPEIANGLLVLAGMAASVAGIFITRRIRTGYVNSLEDSLEAGSIDLEEAAFGTVQNELTSSAASKSEVGGAIAGSPSTEGLSRKMLQQYLHHQRQSTSTAENQAPQWLYAPLKPAEPTAPASDVVDELSAAIAVLRNGDAAAIKRLLQEKTPLPAALVGVVMSLLDSPNLADEAVLALQRAAPGHIGALLDAIHAQHTSVHVRRKICDLLGEVPTQRCVNGLLEFLDTEDLELRFRAASSLLQIRRTDVGLKIPRRRVFELVAIEAATCRRLWFTQVSLDSQITAAPPVKTAVGRRVIQGVTYISTLLLTVLEQQPAILAMRALAHTADDQRGTGIEYLENVLPAALLTELRPLLTDKRLALGKVSGRGDILAGLSQQALSAEDELALLRERFTHPG
jgi:AAA family ATP:ADP antiporter